MWLTDSSPKIIIKPQNVCRNERVFFTNKNEENIDRKLIFSGEGKFLKFEKFTRSSSWMEKYEEFLRKKNIYI